MRHLRLILLASLIGIVSGGAIAGDTLKGTARVIDGARLIVSGQEVRLADIVTPDIGDTCLLRGKKLDCGRLARAGLMDITAGSEVVCRGASGGMHRCTADGYDLSYGQLHAGWAVALDGAPENYIGKMSEARQEQRGLWRATTPDAAQPFTSVALKTGSFSNGKP